MEPEITVTSVFSKAWSLVHGSKGAIWSVAILIILIAGTLEWLFNRIIGINLQNAHYFIRYLMLPIITNIAIASFYAGSIMVAIKRTRNESVDRKTGFQYFHQFVPIAITLVIVGLIGNLFTMIVNIPAIAHALGSFLPYLDLISVLFSLIVYTLFLLSVPMITDKQYTTGQALAASPMLVGPHWFRIFLIFILAYLCIFIVTIPTFIGLIFNSSIMTMIGGVIAIVAMIWLMPFLFLLVAEIYHRLVD